MMGIKIAWPTGDWRGLQPVSKSNSGERLSAAEGTRSLFRALALEAFNAWGEGLVEVAGGL